ncbi:MAG: hypothetical protein M0R39_13265 [Prolixibacteraceae bacterium]|nr:hypothetical protein [Prolixibacteraceae bacterium]
MNLRHGHAPGNVSIPRWFDWESNAASNLSDGMGFQFHDGSIGSEILELQKLLFYRRFNSTMVRLGGTPKQIVILGTKFQFHDGSIGRFRDYIKSQPRICFNSTMVRLGAKTTTLANISDLVSIPRWFDWEKWLKFARGWV